MVYDRILKAGEYVFVGIVIIFIRKIIARSNLMVCACPIPVFASDKISWNQCCAVMEYSGMLTLWISIHIGFWRNILSRRNLSGRPYTPSSHKAQKFPKRLMVAEEVAKKKQKETRCSFCRYYSHNKLSPRTRINAVET